MHIVSKFTDYYDSAVGTGIDKTIIYVRNREQITPPDTVLTLFGKKQRWNRIRLIPDIQEYTSKDGRLINTILIGFCGKIYIGYKFIKIVKDINNIDNYEYDIKYDAEEVKNLVNTKRIVSWHNDHTKILSEFENYRSKIASIDPINIFREFNTPVFALGVHDRGNGVKGEIFIVNPILKDYSFARVFDPYTAFQEIQMFISGVLPSGDDVSETKMTEKQKITQHGFDEKYGFRTRPKSRE